MSSAYTWNMDWTMGSGIYAMSDPGAYEMFRQAVRERYMVAVTLGDNGTSSGVWRNGGEIFDARVAAPSGGVSLGIFDSADRNNLGINNAPGSTSWPALQAWIWGLKNYFVDATNPFTSGQINGFYKNHVNFPYTDQSGFTRHYVREIWNLNCDGKTGQNALFISLNRHQGNSGIIVIPSGFIFADQGTGIDFYEGQTYPRATPQIGGTRITPREQINNTGKIFQYAGINGGGPGINWTLASSGAKPDILMGSGLIRRDDIVGPWILNEMRDALNKMVWTYSDGVAGSLSQPSIINGAIPVSVGGGIDAGFTIAEAPEFENCLQSDPHGTPSSRFATASSFHTDPIGYVKHMYGAVNRSTPGITQYVEIQQVGWDPESGDDGFAEFVDFEDTSFEAEGAYGAGKFPITYTASPVETGLINQSGAVSTLGSTINGSVHAEDPYFDDSYEAGMQRVKSYICYGITNLSVQNSDAVYPLKPKIDFYISTFIPGPIGDGLVVDGWNGGISGIYNDFGDGYTLGINHINTVTSAILKPSGVINNGQVIGGLSMPDIIFNPPSSGGGTGSEYPALQYYGYGWSPVVIFKWNVQSGFKFTADT